MKKKIAMLVCVAGALLMLAGCGGLSEEQRKAAEQAVMPALGEMAEAKNIRGGLYFEYSNSSGGKTTTQKIDMDFEEEGLADNPEKMHIAGDVLQNGNPTAMEAYMFLNEEGDKRQYVCIGDPNDPNDWNESAQSGEEGGPMGMANGMLSSEAYGFTAEKMEKVGDRNAVKLNGYAGVETYSKLLAGTIEGLQAEDLGGAEIPYTVWLDAETHKILQYEIDLKDITGVVLKAALEAQGYSGTEAKINSLLIRMRIDEINGDRGIMIPEAIMHKEDGKERTEGIIERYMNLGG